jgi:protein TonB
LSELSLGCPQRTSPDYPAISRRLGEQGQVKLKVELDETGRITSARVVESSGYKRLDEAGLAAVKNWRCNAAMRDGKAVRAVALQPFDFILN